VGDRDAYSDRHRVNVRRAGRRHGRLRQAPGPTPPRAARLVSRVRVLL